MPSQSTSAATSSGQAPTLAPTTGQDVAGATEAHVAAPQKPSSADALRAVLNNKNFVAFFPGVTMPAVPKAADLAQEASAKPTPVESTAAPAAAPEATPRTITLGELINASRTQNGADASGASVSATGSSQANATDGANTPAPQATEKPSFFSSLRARAALAVVTLSAIAIGFFSSLTPKSNQGSSSQDDGISKKPTADAIEKGRPAVKPAVAANTANKQEAAQQQAQKPAPEKKDAPPTTETKPASETKPESVAPKAAPKPAIPLPVATPVTPETMPAQQQTAPTTPQQAPLPPARVLEEFPEPPQPNPPKATVQAAPEKTPEKKVVAQAPEKAKPTPAATQAPKPSAAKTPAQAKKSGTTVSSSRSTSVSTGGRYVPRTPAAPLLPRASELSRTELSQLGATMAQYQAAASNVRGVDPRNSHQVWDTACKLADRDGVNLETLRNTLVTGYLRNGGGAAVLYMKGQEPFVARNGVSHRYAMVNHVGRFRDKSSAFMEDGQILALKYRPRFLGIPMPWKRTVGAPGVSKEAAKGALRYGESRLGGK